MPQNKRVMAAVEVLAFAAHDGSVHKTLGEALQHDSRLAIEGWLKHYLPAYDVERGDILRAMVDHGEELSSAFAFLVNPRRHANPRLREHLAATLQKVCPINGPE